MSKFFKTVSIYGLIGVIIYFGIAVYVEGLVQKCGGPNELLCGTKRLIVAPGMVFLGSPQYPEVWYFIVTLHAIPLYFIIKYIARKIKD